MKSPHVSYITQQSPLNKTRSNHCQQQTGKSRIPSQSTFVLSRRNLVRLSKIQVVALTLACLLCTGSMHAQFGKLKSLAQQAVGKKASDPSTVAEVAKGPYGEAKATLAPGVKKMPAVKSVDVERQSSGTPEAHMTSARSGKAPQATGTPAATMAAASSGKPQEVVIKVSQIDARQFDAIRGYGPCKKLSNFQILSATQMKVSIDLSGSKSSGTCSLYFRSGGETVFTSNLTIK